MCVWQVSNVQCTVYIRFEEGCEDAKGRLDTT